MLQRTVTEQARQLYWHRQKQERPTARRILHESDELLYWLEECLVQKQKIVPGWLMPRLVTVLQTADPTLPRRLANERRPAQVMEFLFTAQEMLMEQSIKSRRPAKVIPLFK